MCSYMYICAPFLPNFSLGVLNPHVLICGFLLYLNLLSVKSGDFFLGCLKYPLARKYTDDEGMIPDYESEPEMFEEYVLKCLQNELGNSMETLQTSPN